MHLLMTTYCQDIMTNFSCMHDRSTVYPFFRTIFQKMHKRTCQPFQLLVLKINSLQYWSKAMLLNSQ